VSNPAPQFDVLAGTLTATDSAPAFIRGAT
jgi:hypothetical protein